MPKVLLIFPPSTIYGDDPTIPSVVVPLGLAYIAAYLEKYGYNADILDARSLSGERVMRFDNKVLYGLTDDEIRGHIEKANPDIIGISCMYTAYSADAHRVAAIAKNVNADILLTVGGAYASTFPHLVLKDTNVDVVVHAEGEETFLDLVRCIESKKDYHAIKGISFRNEEGKIISNPLRDFIENIDEIPFPARHLLNMDLYLQNTPGPYTMRAPATTMITSRGCPNLCIYCTIQSVWGKRKWRGRSAQNVVDEMELLHKKYGIKELYFMDDSAGTSKTRLEQICLEIIKRKLDIKWATPNGIAHWFLDEPLLKLMKKAGCYRVTFGIESGNMETRRFLGKPFPLEQAKRMLHFANSIGMWTVCTFIIGFPFETEEAINDTIKFACNSGTDMAVFYLLCPHPGTRAYEIFKEEGLLNLDYVMDPSVALTDKDFEEIGLRLAGRGAQTKYFTPVQLQQYVSFAYKSFFKASLKHFLNPLRIIRKIRSVEDLRYAFGIAKAGTRMVFQNVSAKAFKSQDITGYRKNDLEIKEQSDG